MPRLLRSCLPFPLPLPLPFVGLMLACTATASPAPDSRHVDSRAASTAAGPVALAVELAGQPKRADTQQPASCGEHSGACATEATGHAQAAEGTASATCGEHSGSCGSAHAAETASGPSEPGAGGTDEHAAATALTRIGPHGGVCMLSNRYLGERADIPIDVAGKTYHGCCANCAARLAAHEDMRTATDPVNGHPVDKATAVLARDASNRVHYFESELTLAQYSGHP